MDLHKDKERLRHQNQVRLLNKVMNIIPRCPHVCQTRVRKLRHLVLYYHFIKMIHAHTSKDPFKAANDNKSIIQKRKARPVCELPEIQYETEPKRRRANIVFLQVDRSTPKKPNIHEKAVLNEEDYETFYDLEESALTINLGYDIPEVAAVNDVSVNHADFSSDSSKSPVDVSNLVSHKNKASFVSSFVNQNPKLCFGLEPILYSEDNFSSNKESFSDDKENFSSDKEKCFVIENCIDSSSDDKRVKEFPLCNVEKLPETVLANNESSLYYYTDDKHESNIPLNISNTHSSNCLSKNITQQNLNIKSNSILKERNCNRSETYPGQKALEEYVSSILFGNCQNNIDKKLYAHKSSSSLMEKNTHLSETSLIQNHAQYVSSISPANCQDNIDVSNFENFNSSFVKPQLYDMPSFSNSGSNSSNLSTDVLNIVEPISDTSNHSYIDFFDSATSLSDDGNEFHRPVHSTCDVNYLSVPEFAGTSLACYDEIRNGCFLPVCYNYGYLGNNALQNDVTFGVHSNESLPYYGNIFPVGVLENPTVIHPLGFYSSYSDTLTKSNYVNEDVSFYSACSDPMTVVENINSEKIPFIQPKQEVENSNCYLSAMSETNKSSLYDEKSSPSLLQYMNKY